MNCKICEKEITGTPFGRAFCCRKCFNANNGRSVGKTLKGKTYEEIFGVKKAKEERKKRAYEKTPEHIEKIRLKNVGKTRSNVYREKMSRTKKIQYESGEVVVWNKGLTKFTNTSVAKIAQSKIGTERIDMRGDKNPLRKPEILKKVLKIVQSKPNKFEIRALAYLELIFPGRFSYTGDGTCIINGRSADAIDIKSRTVALFHGVYWHLLRHGFENTQEVKRAIESKDAEPFLSKGYRVIFIK